jgi:hypothetical protein
MTDMNIQPASSNDAATPHQEPAAHKPTSGFQRLKGRHHRLVQEHESLLVEYHDLLARHTSMETEIERAALERFQALVQNFKNPSWFEGANLVISQLAQNPEERACDVMVATLASMLQRVSQIRMRVPT